MDEFPAATAITPTPLIAGESLAPQKAVSSSRPPVLLTSLSVRNFRSISEHTFRFGPLGVLIGKNNVGKSTILTAAERLLDSSSKDYLPRDANDPAQPIELEGSLQGMRSVLPLSTDAKLRTKIEECILPDDTIRLRRSSANSYKLEIWQPVKEAFGLPTGIDAALKQLIPEVVFIELFVDPAAQAEAKDSATFGKLLKVVIDDLKSDTDTAMREGMARLNELLNVVVADDGTESDKRTPQLKSIERTLSELLGEAFEGAAARIRVDLPEIPQVLAKARVELHDGDCWTDAGLKGQGQQRAMYFALLRALAEHRRRATESELKRPLLVLVEEPEAFLHPSAIGVLRCALETLSQSSQVLFTTHSPTMVSPGRIPETLLVRKQNVPGDHPTTVCLEPLRDVLAGKSKRIQHLFQYARSAKFLFASKVIVAEGPSDVELLDAMLFRLSGQSLDTCGYACIDADDKLNVADCMAILEARGLPAVGVVDLDFLWRGANTVLSGDTVFEAFRTAFWAACTRDSLSDGTTQELKKGAKAQASQLVLKELRAEQTALCGALQARGIWCLHEGAIESYAGVGQASKGDYIRSATEIRCGDRAIVHEEEVKALLAWAGLSLSK